MSRHSSRIPFILAALAGCGGAPPPAPPPTPPLPPIVAAAAPAPASSAPAAPPFEVPLLAEPLPPLARPIVSVTFAGVTDPLIAVHGRGPKDVWFLADEEHGSNYLTWHGTVLQTDGKAVLKRHEPCSGYAYYGLVVGADEVVALGSNQYYRGVPSGFRATLTPRGAWGCDGGFSGGLTVSSGDHAWKLDCSWSGDACTLTTTDGPQIPVPALDASFALYHRNRTSQLPASALWMKGIDDGWMTLEDDDGRSALRRYNGVTWIPQATLPAGLNVIDLWVDDAGTAWILAERGKRERPAAVVLRFDGKALQPLPLPASFEASFVRGTGPRDVWFIGGGTKAYQWDGEQLRQGSAPFAVKDAWGSPGGEVWLVGGDENGPGPGVAAHTAPLAAAALVGDRR